jgi:hypothetical protein
MIHSCRDQFDDRNVFLLLTLGLVSLAHRFEDLVLDLDVDAAPPPPPRREDAILYLALGVASLSRTVLRHAHAALGSANDAPSSEPAPARGTPDLRSLLAL